MALFLVRHATAGVRGGSGYHDEERPLNAVGHDQAEAIARLFADQPIEAIFSSPALRCRQTVTPLAGSLDIPVDVAYELLEGTSSSRAIAFVRSMTNRNVVMCSHGDVIPDVLRNLEVGGSRLEGRGCAKGSIWQLDNSTERIESGVYLGAVTAPA